jgi:hypothetical protein
MAEAIKLIQKKNHDLAVGFTLPVMQTGLIASGIKFVKTMQSAGVAISYINLMAMDYATGETNMGEAAKNASESTARQLGFDMNKIAITPMIGVNDTSAGNPLTEVFTLENAKDVYKFANDNQVAFLASWSLNRDHNGSSGMPVSNTSSGIAQADYAFASAFQTGTYPPPPPPPDVSVTVINETGSWYDNAHVWVDGNESTMSNGTFKLNSGKHTLGFKVGDNKDSRCIPSPLTINPGNITIHLLNGYY